VGKTKFLTPVECNAFDKERLDEAGSAVSHEERGGGF